MTKTHARHRRRYIVTIEALVSDLWGFPVRIWLYPAVRATSPSDAERKALAWVRRLGIRRPRISTPTMATSSKQRQEVRPPCQ